MGKCRSSQHEVQINAATIRKVDRTANGCSVPYSKPVSSLRDTFSRVCLEFASNQVESLLVGKDTAIEQTVFTIKGTPIAGGEPFLFKGRSMIVYVRYRPSPTGWASKREIIQPAT